MDGIAIREYSHPVIPGSTLRICVPIPSMDGEAYQTGETFAGEFIVYAANGEKHTLASGGIVEDGGRYVVTLDTAFTARLGAGELRYEMAMTSATQRFTLQVGFLIVRDMQGMTQDERDLQCAKDLRSNRLASGGDMQAYSFPGGATIQKVSLKDLEDFIVRLESRVNQANNWYQTW